MVKKVLVALDGSKNAEKVLPYLVPVLKSTGGRAVLVQVVPAVDPAPEAAAKAYLGAVVGRLTGLGVKAEGEIARGDAAAAILGAAEQRGADLLAFTTHGRGGVAQWLFGSVAQKILRGCSRTLLVVRSHEKPRPGVKRVVVPLDGSEESEGALPWAFALARAYGAGVELLYVADEAGVEAGSSKLRGWVEREKRRMEGRFREIERGEPGLKFERSTLEGDAAARIVERGSGRASSVIAMGSRGRTGLSRWLYGSVAEKVLQAASCPLLVVRAASR
jgi:nucleotide-binding universal stress UspA family protein